jgi:hypothetical protein
MWYENGTVIYGPKRPIRAKERTIEDTRYLLLGDAMWALEEAGYYGNTLIARAAKTVLDDYGFKFCSPCKKVKTHTDFYGILKICKSCSDKSHSDYVNNNREKLKEYRRNYYRNYFKNKKEFESALNEKLHTLYRLYDRNDKLLYVGISVRVETRLKEHKTSKVWWDDVVRYELETFPDRASVLAAEELAIKTEFPVHNKVHANP